MAETPRRSLPENEANSAAPPSVPVEADDEGEDLFDGDIIRDYIPDPVLDAYERGSDDDQAYSPATADQRRQAERNLRKRDKDEAVKAGR
eukprot:SAG11_NODE_34534_length_271_cov_0.901163_1_plen_89_part_11